MTTIAELWEGRQYARGRAANPARASVKQWLANFVAAAFVMVVASANAAETDIRIYTVKDNFESVKDEVVDVIVKRGLVIDYTAHIGAMLARTAKDLGATKTIYANAQSLQFCSAKLSRQTMEADPINIAFCPYVIFVYAIPDSPGTTYVGYRPLVAGSPQSRAAIDAVNALLEGIVQEAAGKK